MKFIFYFLISLFVSTARGDGHAQRTGGRLNRAVQTLLVQSQVKQIEESQIPCEEFKESCSYYLCVESQKKCGEKGYLQNFGYRYCQKFTEEKIHHFSDDGMRWALKTKECLLGNLENLYHSESSCSEIKKEAFKNHDECYVKSGFCELSFRDQWNATKIGLSGILKLNSWSAVFNLLHACRARREID
ncbi:MAG: hypothetical protein H6621_00910 [Halobacteriovoraceae bacterium]|nr:hypothetical protein [Halobacteriovoraceae bacterium]MCB9093601.1 hypothetical protein [Halobacteriovoraceae bacterium]